MAERSKDHFGQVIYRFEMENSYFCRKMFGGLMLEQNVRLSILIMCILYYLFHTFICMRDFFGGNISLVTAQPHKG